MVSHQTHSLQQLVCLLLISVLSTAGLSGAAENVSTTEQIVKDKPIVIHTQMQNYDQPTLDEYQKCHENRDKCLQVCQTVSNPSACETECPTCPILISQDVVVQGINDTDYRAPVVTSGNTTNVIRLTNEIRNIIENNMGNITARNENNVHIHQNASSSGGKYGLGYTDGGSCCIVVRAAQNCDEHRFATAKRCHHKRQRVCGEHCKARVMYAKRVLRCSDDDSNNCQQSIQYATKPHRRRATRRCHYVQHWPFVTCRGQNTRNSYKSLCQRCLQIPYGLILYRGIPNQCINCYSGQYGGSYAPSFNPWYSPDMYNPSPSAIYGENFDWEEEFLPGGKDWSVQKTKCRRPDGSVVENCKNGVDSSNNGLGSGEGSTNVEENGIPEDPLEQLPETQDEIENYDDVDEDYVDDDDLERVDAMRRRRHTFRRSAYSLRNT